MRAQKQFAVYILASKRHGTLYVGVTSNLQARVWQHKEGAFSSFTAKYKVKDLVWYEVHETARSAIQREKTIKRWLRRWKIDLIEKANPDWRDLYEDLF